MDPRPEIAEAIGTFALVTVGLGAIQADAATGALGTVGIALAFGSVILTMVYAMGHVSGAHFNPAITIAFAATAHFPWRRVPTYLAAQAGGATAGALLVDRLMGPVATVGTTRLTGIGVAEGFVVEVVATFFLALVIVAVATDTRAPPSASGLAIGLAVAMGVLFAGPFTGASMNPARSLGPALASGSWTWLWLYLTAPVVGALIAMGTYEYLRPRRLSVAARRPLGAQGPIPLLQETRRP